MVKIPKSLAVLFCMLAYIHAFTIRQSTGYKDFNKAVLVAHNKARTDPKFYADLAYKQSQYFIYDDSGKPTKEQCLATDFVPKSTKCYKVLVTQEGIDLWNEAIKYLNEFKTPLKELKWSESLAQACYDHSLDQGIKGGIGHYGSDKSSPKDRIDRYAITDVYGENLAYMNVYYPEDPILGLIVDDGVPDRGHRKLIYSADYTHVGINWGCHKDRIEMWCLAYGVDPQDKTQNFVANVSPQLKTCVNYSPFTKDETSGLYTLASITTAPPIATAPSPRTVVETIDNLTITTVYSVGGVVRTYVFKMPNGDGTFGYPS